MKRALAIAIGLALAAAPACAPSGPEPPRHVLVILVDTLRADHTSLVAPGRGTTPRLLALADEGTRFTRHLANAPWTKPSVASILTGLLPPAHGSQWGDFNRVKRGEVDVLAEGFDTLPEILSAHGYATAAWMTNTTLTPAIGYAQGFDRYELLPANLKGDRRSLEEAAKALDEAQRPTFVWCHLMAMHNYRLPAGRRPAAWTPRRVRIQREAPFAERLLKLGFRFREPAVDVYDELARWVDEQVAALVRGVRERHPGTLIVFTSDHGEEFGEHGGYLHARTLHSELIHVPLVIWGPGVPEGAVVSRLTQSVDLLPTVLDRLGLPPVPGQGRALFGPEAEGREPAVYAEKRNGDFAMRAWITPDGKLLETKPPGPPGEKPPISGEGSWRFYGEPVGPERVDALAALAPDDLAARRARLEETWAASVRVFEERAGGGVTRRELREEEIEALRALGYADPSPE